MKKLTILMFAFLMIILATFIHAVIQVNINSDIADNSWSQTGTIPIFVNSSGNYTVYTCEVFSNGTGTYGGDGERFEILNNTNTTIFRSFQPFGSIIYNVRCNGTRFETNITTGIGFLNSSVNRTVRIDATNPTIDIHNPIENYFSTFREEGNSFAAIFNFTPTDLNLQNCSVIIDGVQNATNNSVLSGTPLTYFYNHTNSSNGTISWYASCNDLSGREFNTTARTLYISGAPNVVNNSAGLDGANTYTSSQQAVLGINVQGGGSDYNCQLYSNSTGTWGTTGAFETVTNNTDTNITRFFNEGHISWNFLCTQNGDDFPFIFAYAAANTTKNVDATAPTVETQVPANNSFKQFGANLSAVLTDINPDFCSLQINGTVNQTTTAISGVLNSFIFNADTANPTNTTRAGVYSWSIGCNDSAGNFATTTNFTLTMDNHTPSLNRNINYSTHTLCNAWTLEINGSEPINFSVAYGSTIGAANYTASSVNFSRNHTMNLTFNTTYEHPFFVNLTIFDRAGNNPNGSATVLQMITPSPAPLCAGWNLYPLEPSSARATINLSDIQMETRADFVYWFNSTNQTFKFFSTASTTHGGTLLGIADVVQLFNGNNSIWLRSKNLTGRNNFKLNITTGHNYLPMYYNQSFSNVSHIYFRNQTGGNQTPSNKTGSDMGAFETDFNFFNSWNNSDKTFVPHIFPGWVTNNATAIGDNRMYMEIIHVFSIANITINFSGATNTYIFLNWTS